MRDSLIRDTFADALRWSASRAAAITSTARILEARPEHVARVVGAELERARPRKKRKDAGRPRPKTWARPGPPRRESCHRGHALYGFNVLTRPNGSRACRACHRLRVNANERKRAPRARRAS